MLKKYLFLFALLMVTTQTCAAASDKPSIDSIQSLIEQGAVSAALLKMQQMVNDDPKNYQAWFLLGVNQAERGAFDDAIKSFNHVIALQPTLAEPHNNLAVIYNEMGNYRAAVDALEKSLALKPDYLTAQENIGDLYVKLAADAYRKVLAKDQNAALQQRYQRLLKVHADVPVAAVEPIVHQSDKTKVDMTPSRANTGKRAKSEPVIIKHTVMLTQFKKEVLSAVEAWRVAWSNKNLPVYFAAYSEDFKYGDRFASFAKWKAYKIWVIQKREFIKVDIEHVVVTAFAENVIKVQFLQHFRSDTYNNDDNKEMLFKKGIDGWKIIYEASV